MKMRFLFYGITGWIVEILWTGLGSFHQGDWKLAGHTYLWMFPIYGMAVFLEPVHEIIRTSPWWVRGFIWASLIISIEYACGWFLKSVLGICPWDYAAAGSLTSVSGFIRLDYVPFWCVLGLAFEKLHDYITKYNNIVN